MSVPDRSALVATIVGKHQDLFGTDESRRAILYYLCDPIGGLNQPTIDNGLWGLLRKNDKGGFIPSDILVWKPELRTVDVLAGPQLPNWPKGAPSWQVQGTIDGVVWEWVPAPLPTGGSDPPAPPVPPPAIVQPYPDEPEWWAQYEHEVAGLYAAAGRSFPDNVAAFRWFSRCAYDIGVGMEKDASKAKHLAELKAALGL